MNRDELDDWIAAYERAWRTAGTDALTELFAPEGTYKMGPYEQPCEGRDRIAELWEREREGHDELFTMESDIVAVEGDTGVVRVHVRYGQPVDDEYRDLWIIRFDRTRHCVSFEEWPFQAG